MEKKKLNPEVDTTRVVNILGEPFTGYAANEPREFKEGEEKIMPIWVAQVVAKQIVDKVLQEKHKVHNTLTDTPIRSSLFARVLPDMAEIADVKPLTPEEEQEEIKKELKKQKELLEQFGKDREKKDEEKDKKIKALEKDIENLKKGSKEPKE